MALGSYVHSYRIDCEPIPIAGYSSDQDVMAYCFMNCPHRHIGQVSVGEQLVATTSGSRLSDAVSQPKVMSWSSVSAYFWCAFCRCVSTLDESGSLGVLHKSNRSCPMGFWQHLGVFRVLLDHLELLSGNQATTRLALLKGENNLAVGGGGRDLSSEAWEEARKKKKKGDRSIPFPAAL